MREEEYDEALRHLGELAKQDHDLLTAQIGLLRLALEWRPIETAPRDGSLVLFTAGYHRLLCDPSGWICIGCWLRDMHGEGSGFHHAAGIYKIYPTHWMPLPGPP
jgi:hypothetical protein